MLLLFASLADAPEEKRKVEAIYRQYGKLIKYVALSRLQKEDWAEDAVHEVMMRVILHIEKIKGCTEEELKGFLYLVTRNICNDILRKETRRAAEELDSLWQTPKSGSDPQEQLGAQILADYIAALPDRYRDPLELTAYYGFSAKEAAKLLNITPAACRKRLERARTILQEKLEKGGDHLG